IGREKLIRARFSIQFYVPLAKPFDGL
ncbi:MAG: hypothetical protein QOJ02_1606, partial [Acidobacteriota bacterium]|nr:hypothetical protein [Acidobacteriota bacterium]